MVCVISNETRPGAARLFWSGLSGGGVVGGVVEGANEAIRC